MTKQEFLDLEANNDDTKVVQLFLTTLNKTKVSQLRRAIQELDRALWKSWMKEIPINHLLTLLQSAENYFHQEKTETDNQ